MGYVKHLDDEEGEAVVRLTTGLAEVLLGMTLGCLPLAAFAELGAAEIVAKAHDLEGGEDSISRLSFSLQRRDGSEKKLVYTMVWKEYEGKDDVDDKVIFFSEFPPDDKGKSFMVWVYEDKTPDEWMYLPELRMVRKVTHSEGHRHNDEDDDYAHSVLSQVVLVPRDPGLDNHTLLGSEEIDGHSAYVVDSVPKQASKNYPYGKTRRWISKDNFLTERADFYGETGAVEKRLTTKWKRIGDAWVWEQVVGVDLRTKDRTVLDISDVRLNNNLDDEVFSARTLRLGKDSVLR